MSCHISINVLWWKEKLIGVEDSGWRNKEKNLRFVGGREL